MTYKCCDDRIIVSLEVAVGDLPNYGAPADAAQLHCRNAVWRVGAVEINHDSQIIGGKPEEIKTSIESGQSVSRTNDLDHFVRQNNLFGGQEELTTTTTLC